MATLPLLRDGQVEHQRVHDAFLGRRDVTALTVGDRWAPAIGRSRRTWSPAPLGLEIQAECQRVVRLGAGRWVQPKDVWISRYAEAAPPLESANNACLLADPSGNLYALFAAGGIEQAGRGFLELAYRPAGAADAWSRQRVCEDRDLVGGNVESLSATLARGPGHQVYAVYSKAVEQHRRLYYRVYEGGQPLGGEIEVAASDHAGAFAARAGDDLGGGSRWVVTVVPRQAARARLRVRLDVGGAAKRALLGFAEDGARVVRAELFRERRADGGGSADLPSRHG